jgi:hypothetical protein
MAQELEPRQPSEAIKHLHDLVELIHQDPDDFIRTRRLRKAAKMVLRTPGTEDLPEEISNLDPSTITSVYDLVKSSNTHLRATAVKATLGLPQTDFPRRPRIIRR